MGACDEADFGMPDDPCTVSILIVGYNSADLIENCLGSIPSACQRYDYEVLLVDQGDGSTEKLVASEFPETNIIQSCGNLGFAGGNNLLAKSARGKFLLLLNPDVELKVGAIDALLKAARKYPKASAWGGVTLDRTDKPDVGNTVHVPSLREMMSRVFGRSSAGLDPGHHFGTDEKVSTLSGGLVLIDRRAWDVAAGLDERYFLYCEEVDFFYRLTQLGHHFWRIVAAKAYHDIGHGEVASPSRYLYRAAGTMQFARLHWPIHRQYLAFLLMWMGAMQRFIAGKFLGIFAPRFRNLAASNRVLALRPGLWRFGYDPKKGLLAKLETRS